MPPDVLHRDRLQKVLKALEVEAIAENLHHLKKETGDDFDLPVASSASATIKSGNDNLKVTRSEKVILYNNYQYVDNGAYDFMWTRIAYFGSLQALHLLALYYIVVHGTMTNLKTWLFGNKILGNLCDLILIVPFSRIRSVHLVSFGCDSRGAPTLES